MSSLYWKGFSSVFFPSGSIAWFYFVRFVSFPFMHLPRPHHILQREYSLPQVYWTKSIMITMYVFVFMIPRSYTVSIGQAVAGGLGQRAGRRRKLSILLGRRQKGSDPRVSGLGIFCLEGHQASLLTQAPSS